MIWRASSRRRGVVTAERPRRTCHTGLAFFKNRELRSLIPQREATYSASRSAPGSAASTLRSSCKVVITATLEVSRCKHVLTNDNACGTNTCQFSLKLKDGAYTSGRGNPGGAAGAVKALAIGWVRVFKSRFGIELGNSMPSIKPHESPRSNA